MIERNLYAYQSSEISATASILKSEGPSFPPWREATEYSASAGTFGDNI
jgi:hypothetical protein